MAWTDPRTWVTGELVTAALLNTHLRDNLKAIGDAWTAYTPTWTSSGTAPAIGNGTLTGAYLKAGKLVVFRLKLTIGSTTTVGTSTYRFGLPVAAIGLDVPVGQGLVFDTSASDRRFCGAYTTATTEVTLRTTNDNAVVSATGPFAWATGDTIDITGTYQAS